jgi:peptidoglycan/LPS O-acetylase OafA/YrhL
MGIELCRGLAALMVVLTHYSSFLPNAPAGFGFLWTGVDLFFVISGFVFSPMLLQNTRAPGRLDAPLPFWLRRFFRIYPLYLLALVAYFLGAAPGALTNHYFLRHLVFLHTTHSFEEAYYFNPAFWTLPVEMEFYLVLPLLALLRGRVRWLLLVSLASLVWCFYARYLRGPEDFWRVLSVHLPALLPEFMLGTLLAAAVAQGKAMQWRWCSRQALAAGGCGLALLVLAYQIKFGGFGLDTNRLLDAPWNFLCASAYALLMFPLLLTNELAWPLWLRQLALLAGASSYGVYLFHNLIPPLLVRAGLTASGIVFVLLAMSLTLAIALLLYRVYENPLRRCGRELAQRLAADAGGASRQ